MRVREARGQVPRRAADAAADVQHACGPPRAAPVQHLVHKVNFGALEVLLFVARRALLGRVVAQVDVLAPVVLQDALPARLPPRLLPWVAAACTRMFRCTYAVLVLALMRRDGSPGIYQGPGGKSPHARMDRCSP